MEWNCHVEGLRMNCTENSGTPTHPIDADDCQNSDLSVMWQSFGDFMFCLVKDFSDLMIRIWFWLTNLWSEGTSNAKQKEDTMNWIRTVIPNASSDFSESWKDGILLCCLAERLVPGSCPLPETSYRKSKIKSTKRALDVLGKRFGLIPDVTPEEVLNYSSNSETKLLSFLCQLKEKVEAHSTNKITEESKSENNVAQSRPDVRPCFAKGTGLVVGFVGRLAKVNVFCAPVTHLDIVFLIKGPSNASCCKRITSRSPKRKTSFTKSLQKPRPPPIDRSTSVCESWTYEQHDECVEESDEEKKTEIVLEYEIHSDRIEMGYIPVESGQHKITILWHGQHIPGSPFLANVKDTLEKFNDGKIVRLKPSLRPKSSSETKDVAEKNNQSRKPSVRFKGVDDGSKQLCKVTKRKVLRYIVKIGDQEIAVEADSSDLLAPALLKLDYQMENNSLICRRNSWGFAGDVERKKSLVRQFCVDLEEKDTEPHKRSSSFHLGLNNEQAENTHFEDASNAETPRNLRPMTEGAENGQGNETQTSFDDSQNGNDEFSSFSEFEGNKSESTSKVRKRGICIGTNSAKEENCNFTFTENISKDLEIKTQDNADHITRKNDEVIDFKEDHLVPIPEDNAIVQNSSDSSERFSLSLMIKNDSQISDCSQAIEEKRALSSMGIELNARPDSEEIEKKVNRHRKYLVKRKWMQHLNYFKVVCNRSRFPLRRKTNLKVPTKLKQTKHFKHCNESKNCVEEIEGSTSSLEESSREEVSESTDRCRFPSDNRNIHTSVLSNKINPLFSRGHDGSNSNDEKPDHEDTSENVRVLNLSNSTDRRRRLNPRLINVHYVGEERSHGLIKASSKACSAERYGRKRRRVLRTDRPVLRRRSKYKPKQSQPMDNENSDDQMCDMLLQQPDTSPSETVEADEQGGSENFRSLSSENLELPSSSFELFEVAQDASKHDTSKAQVGLYRSNSENCSKISQTLLTPHFTFQNLKDKSDSSSKFSLSKSVKDIVKDLENNSFLSRKTFRENFFSVSLNFPPLAANDDRTSVETRIRQWETTSSLPSIHYKGKESKWQLPEREKLSVVSDVQSKTLFFENIFRDLSADPAQDTNLPSPEGTLGMIRRIADGRGKSGSNEHSQDKQPTKLKISPSASGECAFYQATDISYRSRTTHQSHEKRNLVGGHRLERRHSDPGPIKKRRKGGLEYSLADLEISRTNSVSVLDAISSSFVFSHDQDDDSGDEYIDDEIPDYAAMLLNEHHADAGLLFDSRHSSKPKAEECIVFGGGIYYGHVAVKNHFQVLTKGAGRGNLSVSLQGSSSHDVAHVSVTYVRKDIYNVIYQVMEPGYYLVSVRWSDVAVPGSPFVCKVTY